MRKTFIILTMFVLLLSLVLSCEQPCTHTNVEEKVVTEATCTKDGEKQVVCKDCGVVITSTAITKKGHTFGDPSVTKPATCEEVGELTQICTVCNEKKITTIEREPHNFKTEPVHTAATCEKGGFNTFTCKNCDATDIQLIDNEPALGHDYEGVAWVTDKEPTCTEDGKRHQVCKNNCGIDNEEILSALGHDWSGWQTIDATCEVDGSKTRTCLRMDCNESETEILSALGHDYKDVSWEIEEEATCIKVGKEYQLCVHGCGEKNYRDIAKKEHSWGSPAHTAATCEDAGFNIYACTTVGCTEIKKEVLEDEPALGHDLDDGAVITEPSDFAPGIKKYTCKRTDCGYVKEEEIPAKILNPNDYTREATFDERTFVLNSNDIIFDIMDAGLSVPPTLDSGTVEETINAERIVKFNNATLNGITVDGISYTIGGYITVNRVTITGWMENPVVLEMIPVLEAEGGGILYATVDDVKFYIDLNAPSGDEIYEVDATGYTLANQEQEEASSNIMMTFATAYQVLSQDQELIDNGVVATDGATMILNNAVYGETTITGSFTQKENINIIDCDITIVYSPEKQDTLVIDMGDIPEGKYPDKVLFTLNGEKLYISTME